MTSDNEAAEPSIRLKLQFVATPDETFKERLTFNILWETSGYFVIYKSCVVNI